MANGYNRARYNDLCGIMENGFDATPEGEALMGQIQAELLAIEDADRDIVLEKYKSQMERYNLYVTAIESMKREMSHLAHNLNVTAEKLGTTFSGISPTEEAEQADAIGDDIHPTARLIVYRELLKAAETRKRETSAMATENVRRCESLLNGTEYLITSKLEDGQGVEGCYLALGREYIHVTSETYMELPDFSRVKYTVEPNKVAMMKYLKEGNEIHGVEIKRDNVIKLK